MKNIITLAVSLFSLTIFAQVGINNNTPKATLDITAQTTNGSKPEGLLPPRLTGDQIQAGDAQYTAAQAGIIIYATAAATAPSIKTANITAAGYYFYDGTAWQKLTSGAAVADATTTAKGIVQLAGDLSGTAASPAIAANAVTSGKILDGTVANADLATGTGGIYKGSGSLSGNTTVTQGANTLAFTSTATNGFSVDGTTLSVDAANDRVGVGTSSPSNKLHVNAVSDPLRLNGLQSGSKTMNYLVTDTNGIIKTVPPESTNPSNVYVFVKMTNDQSATYSSNSFTNTIIPFDTKVTDTNNAYNLATQTFTAPENGYYLFNQVLSMNFDCTGASNTYVYSIVNAAGAKFQSGGFSSDTNTVSFEGGSAVQSVVVYLTAGQTTNFYYNIVTSGVGSSGGSVAQFKFPGESSTLCGRNANSGISNYLTITKL